MQMIDVLVRYQRVQRRIDRASAGIQIEDAVAVHRVHHVFDRRLRPAIRIVQIQRLHRAHLVEIQRRKAIALRKSPPEPFSQRTSTGSCVSGSVSVNFDEVLPPPVFVKVKSSPSLFERYTKRSTPSNWPATSSCQRYFTNRNLSLPGLCELIKLLLQ